MRPTGRHVPLLLACAALTVGLVGCDGEVTLPSELPSISRSVSRSTVPPVSTTGPISPSETISDTPTASPTRTKTSATSATTTSETTTTSDPPTVTETRTQTETETQTETRTQTQTQTATEVVSGTGDQSPDGSAPGSGSSDDPNDEVSEPPWLALGLLAVLAALGAFLLLRRRSSEVSVPDAYRAAADLRDRVSAAVSGGASIDTFGLLSQIDAADLTIRNARSSAKPDDMVALDRLVLAVAGLRSGVEAAAAGSAGAHAADSEADLLRALAGLNAALAESTPGSSSP